MKEKELIARKMTVKLKSMTQFRVKILEVTAIILRIPMTINYQELREYREAEVIGYIEKCCALFGPVFDVKYLPFFQIWIKKFLHKDLMNPFNLHDHPLETTALYFGKSHYGTESSRQQMDELWDKYRESGLKLAWYENENTENQEP